MFGYIMIDKQELKLKEYDIYHAYYCGLCKTLKKKYGISGQATLSFDMSFLLLLLTSLYEPEEFPAKCRCVVHPARKHHVLSNEFTTYTADMNFLLAYYKCQDDWVDEHSYKKHLFQKLLKSGYQKLTTIYPDKISKISESLDQLRLAESAGTGTIDQMSGYFGAIMSVVFSYREDEWTFVLQSIGFFLGKFIYLLDAYEDIEEDLKKGLYNPLSRIYQTEQFESHSHSMLTMMMAECSRLFEQLPLLMHTGILRNILYSGVWSRYQQIQAKRQNKNAEIL